MHTDAYICSSSDTHNTHLTLKHNGLTAKTCGSDRSNLIYNACMPCVYGCVSGRIGYVCQSVRRRQAEGVRGQNCKFFKCHMSRHLSVHYTLFSSTHTHRHTHLLSINLYPFHTFILLCGIISQLCLSHF